MHPHIGPYRCTPHFAKERDAKDVCLVPQRSALLAPLVQRASSASEERDPVLLGSGRDLLPGGRRRAAEPPRSVRRAPGQGAEPA